MSIYREEETYYYGIQGKQEFEAVLLHRGGRCHVQSVRDVVALLGERVPDTHYASEKRKANPAIHGGEHRAGTFDLPPGEGERHDLAGGTSDVEDQPDRYRADHGGDQPPESHPGGADDPEAGAGPDHLLIRHPEYGEPSDSLNRRGTKTRGNDVDSRTVVPGCVFVPRLLMGMHRSCLSSDAGDRLDVLHLTQGVAEGLHILHIEDVKLDLSFKDTLVALDAQFVDVHVELP